MSIGRITVDLLARTGSFETDLNRSAKLADKRAKEIDAAFRKAGAAIGVALVAGATAAAVGMKSTIDRMDELSKAAQRVGLPTEDLSKLAYAGELADVSLEALTGALGKLTKSQAAALNATSEQARVFDALGISIKNADGSLRSSSDVLADFADRFRDLQGSPEAMAAGFSLFGRSFQELVPLLKDGGQGIRDAGDELERMGGVLSTEAGRNAEAFNDNLTRLKVAAGALGTQVAMDLLPNVVRLTDRIVEFSADGANAERIARKIGDAFDYVAGTAATFGQKVDDLGTIIEAITGEFVALGTAAQGAFDLDTGKMKAALKLWQDSQSMGRAAANDFLFNTSGASRGSGGVDIHLTNGMEGVARGGGANVAKLQSAFAGPSRNRKAKKDVDETAEAYKRLNEQLDREIALFGQTGEAAQVRYDTEHGALATLAQSQKDNLILKAEYRDQLQAEKELADEMLKKANAEAEAREAQAKRVKDFISDQKFELSLLGLSNIERAKAVALRYANVDAASKEGREIASLAESYERLREQTAFLDDFRRNLEDTFVSIVDGSKSAKEAITDFFDNLAAMIARAIAQRWVEQLLGSYGSTGGGSAGGWIGALVGMFGGARAEGGPVGMGQTYLVGERGPELFVPRTAGAIVPAGLTTRMAGGNSTINQTFVVQGTPDRRTREQLARDSGRAAARGIARTGR